MRIARGTSASSCSQQNVRKNESVAPDLLDRALLVTLRERTKRITEEELMGKFDELPPPPRLCLLSGVAHCGSILRS